MNRQAIFDRIAKHLLTQNAKSIFEQANEFGDPPTCAYREYDPNAKRVRKCAVGCLIPFRNYHDQLEGSNVFGPAVKEALPPSLHIESDDDLGFLSGLQTIHDDQPVTAWKRSLAAFAYREGLDAAILEAF